MRREPVLRSGEAGIRSQEKSAAVAHEAFDAQRHPSGLVEIRRPHGWDDFRQDPDPTRRSPTMPGATVLLVAGVSEGLEAVANRLAHRAFETTGTGRTDLVASDKRLDFYGAPKHKEQVGFRIYPDHNRG